MTWPLQNAADEFYGDPRGYDGVNASWEKGHIIQIVPPYPMYAGGRQVRKIPVHRKCAESLKAVLTNVAAAYPDLEEAGVTEFDGLYTFRVMRGGHRLSMHAYGCAIDINAAQNPFRSRRHLFQKNSPIVECFEAEGWEWGGRWRSPDAMHFQAARTRR